MVKQAGLWARYQLMSLFAFSSCRIPVLLSSAMDDGGRLRDSRSLQTGTKYVVLQVQRTTWISGSKTYVGLGNTATMPRRRRGLAGSRQVWWLEGPV